MVWLNQDSPISSRLDSRAVMQDASFPWLVARRSGLRTPGRYCRGGAIDQVAGDEISAVGHGQQHHTRHTNNSAESLRKLGEKSFHETISHTVGIVPEDSQPLMMRPARQPLVPPRSERRDPAKACPQARTRNVR